MAAHHQSALGMALNGKSAFVDIPQPRDRGAPVGRDNLTVVSIDASTHASMLPTPPNSISPNLAPHVGPNRPGSPTTSVQHESDFDLRDAPSALNAEALDRLGELDSVGAITPAMLAKHYLPDILLSHGPLAIRHLMSYLTTSLPGFSRITSAKARRLVVAALEGRGGGADGHDDVIFEKVGWGRWDARKKGHTARADITPPGSLPSSSYLHGAMPTVDDEDDYHDMLEHEADKMSMDGDDAYQSSEAPDPLDIDMDDGDETDDEDWQSIGAEALKARSLPTGSLPSTGPRLYQPIAYSTAPRFRSKTPGNLAQSMPTRAIPVQAGHHYAAQDSQERAAIEALLSLGGN